VIVLQCRFSLGDVKLCPQWARFAGSWRLGWLCLPSAFGITTDFGSGDHGIVRIAQIVGATFQLSLAAGMLV
jgi:hypothetical protein